MQQHKCPGKAEFRLAKQKTACRPANSAGQADPEGWTLETLLLEDVSAVCGLLRQEAVGVTGVVHRDSLREDMRMVRGHTKNWCYLQRKAPKAWGMCLPIVWMSS